MGAYEEYKKLKKRGIEPSLQQVQDATLDYLNIQEGKKLDKLIYTISEARRIANMAMISPEERIVKWVAKNAVKESSFLTPHPRWTVDAHHLLDEIAEAVGLPKEQISNWVKEVSNGN